MTETNRYAALLQARPGTCPLGFGTAAIGHLYHPVTDDDAGATLSAAWELGIRLFDTAPLYGNGIAERRLGDFLASGQPAGQRDAYVVSTKVGRVLPVGATPDDQLGFDYSRDAVMASIEQSLGRLGLDRLDVVLVHDPDDHFDQAISEAVPQLIELRDQGVISAVGIGMNQSAMLARFVRSADIDCVLVAGRYTLLDRQAAEDLLPLCQSRGVAVVAGGVFNGGILTGDPASAFYDYAPAQAAVVAQANRLRAICTRYDVPLPAAALQYVLRHPAVTVAVVGARRPEEIEEDEALRRLSIPDELWRALDDELAQQDD